MMNDMPVAPHDPLVQGITTRSIIEQSRREIRWVVCNSTKTVCFTPKKRGADGLANLGTASLFDGHFCLLRSVQRTFVGCPVCSAMNASAKKIGMREKVFPDGTYVEREATSELIPQAVVTANLNAVRLEARQ